jgi:formiminoglutamase
MTPTAGRLGVLGAPLRLGSITPGRCDLAPRAIRAALARYSTWDFDANIDIRRIEVADLGDLPLAAEEPPGAFAPLRDAVQAALDHRDAAIILGGDNSVTRPGVHGLGIPLDRCGLLTLDAHLDLRSLDRGLTNGNPVRALLADGLPAANIVQVGIQSFANSPDYAAVARNEGIRVVTAECFNERTVPEALDDLASRTDAIYVDLDLDVMDRVFAPGTPGSRPGGLTPAQVRHAAHICGRHPKVRAIDLVELDPERDVSDATALAAAACLLSFASGYGIRCR